MTFDIDIWHEYSSAVLIISSEVKVINQSGWKMLLDWLVPPRVKSF